MQVEKIEELAVTLKLYGHERDRMLARFEHWFFFSVSLSSGDFDIYRKQWTSVLFYVQYVCVAKRLQMRKFKMYMCSTLVKIDAFIFGSMCCSILYCSI